MTIVVDKSAPFTHAPTSVQSIMTTVLLALVPATLFDLWLFGWPAVFLFVITVGSCLVAEAVCLMLLGRPVQATLFDGSAALTGWLLAMSLPPWAPWWIGVLGAVFAIPLAKHAFGGLGQNVFNPAMVARVALLVSFPVQMTLFVAPGSPSLADAMGITFGTGTLDSMSAASALGYIKTELSRHVGVTESLAKAPNWLDMAKGYKPGSMGETSAILVLLGGLVLLAKRIISWHIPVSVLATLFVMGTLFNAVDPERFTPGWFHVLAGASMLGAFFIATDYVTSPVSKKGQLVYGFGVGLMTWVIRSFAGYPEGMAFAVLLMNALTPIIDQHFRPRAFGRTSKGEPLPVKGDK
ncbi:MAG: RnfABCDGE type electron transport complex subunit D [Actinomycetota bacterium]